MMPVSWVHPVKSNYCKKKKKKILNQYWIKETVLNIMNIENWLKPITV